MKQFKDHKIGVKNLLNIIPDALIDKLAQDTKVDHYAKVLKGKNLFYLLLYSIIENDKLSQRSLEDTFNEPAFKTLFELDKSETVRHSSISERLSKINSDYFRQIYNSIYTKYSKRYSIKEFEKHNIIRVDSSVITDISGRMEQGIKQCNQSKKSQKNIKYSVAYDGLFACDAKVFNEKQYVSEDIALPEVVKSHNELSKSASNIYVLDRGFQSVEKMDSFCESDISFVCRLKANRRYIELSSNITNETQMEFDGLELNVDSIVNLNPKTNKSITSKDKAEPNKYRLVKVSRKDDGETFSFLTNDLKLSPCEIAAYYKRRWDIEVFFRFIKQELNVSHLVSLNKNGIEVILNMTLIAAILLMIYKKENEIGYTTAKRRFKMELRNEIIANIVKICGGDPSLFFSH